MYIVRTYRHLYVPYPLMFRQIFFLRRTLILHTLEQHFLIKIASQFVFEDMSNNIVLFVLVLLSSCCARGFTYPRASFFDILNFELNFIENYERRGVGDFQKWKEIQISKDDDDDDLAEKIYNGLETMIQEKISDTTEVRYHSTITK